MCSASGRCVGKFHEPYHLEEGEVVIRFHWLFTSLAFTAGPAWVALLWPTAPIAVFFVAASFVSGAVIRCALKILPWKIIRDARKSRKSRQTCCFWTMPRTMPKRCLPWWKQRLPRAQSIKPKLAHSRWPHTPAKHLALPSHIMMLGPPSRWC